MRKRIRKPTLIAKILGRMLGALDVAIMANAWSNEDSESARTMKKNCTKRTVIGLATAEKRQLQGRNG